MTLKCLEISIHSVPQQCACAPSLQTRIFLRKPRERKKTIFQTSRRPKASRNQKKDQQSNEPSTRCSPPAPGVHHLFLRLQGAEIQSGRSPAIANTALGWPNLGETHAEMPDPEKELLLIWGIA